MAEKTFVLYSLCSASAGAGAVDLEFVRVSAGVRRRRLRSEDQTHRL